MKFDYLKDLRGPNGERFADEPVDFRKPEWDEWFVGSNGLIQRWNAGLTHREPRLILRKLEEPKAGSEVVRYRVEPSIGRLVANDIPIHVWPGTEAFRGFVYELPNGQEQPGVPILLIWWSVLHQDWTARRGDGFTIPIRPSFVEAAK